MPIPSPSHTSTALVTGASSGIGASLARQLAQRGHHVTLVARRTERLDALADELRSAHRAGAEVIACDLTDADARRTLAQTVSDAGRDVNVLINNAGFATGGPFVDSDIDAELGQVRVLVEAVVHLSGLFVPDMTNRRAGAVLNVASTAGFQPLPWSTGYSAAKAHTVAFSEALHYEVARTGVTVTALCPGPVKTEFWDLAGDQPIEQAMPGPMWVDVDKVAAAGLRGLERGQRLVVPGTAVKLSVFGARWSPHGIQLPVLARAMHPSRKEEGPHH